MPTREQVAAADRIAQEAMARHRGRMQILYVLPDYYEEYPKACYGGWGEHYLLVMPGGRTLPCHGATHITTLEFYTRRHPPLQWILTEASAFQAVPRGAGMQGAFPTLPRP